MFILDRVLEDSVEQNLNKQQGVERTNDEHQFYWIFSGPMTLSTTRNIKEHKVLKEKKY